MHITTIILILTMLTLPAARPSRASLAPNFQPKGVCDARGYQMVNGQCINPNLPKF